MTNENQEKEVETSTPEITTTEAISNSTTDILEEPSIATGNIMKANKLKVSLVDISNAVFETCGEKYNVENRQKFEKLLNTYLKQIVDKNPCAKEYNIIIMFDNTILVKADSDKIYKAITKIQQNNKPLLLVLVSPGGEPGSAYLIGKLCREFSNGKFIVTIPRSAKSAATLLACAADEIHMGGLSELGPIDPQINGMPVLGLKNSIEHIANLVNNVPSSSDMFAKYLELTVKPILIGSYERAAESAVQYAEKLLLAHSDLLKTTPLDIAHKLVYDYKDHGFVIDKLEAIEIFGENIIKTNSNEYKLGNEIYNALSEIEDSAKFLNHTFYFIGSLDSLPVLFKRN